MRKNVRLEKWYETQLRHFLVKNGFWITKLHGNVYQSGLPDWLLCNPEGKLSLIELKVITDRKSYFISDIIKLLKGTQISNILLLAKRRASVAIIAGCSEGYLFVSLPYKEDKEIRPKNLKEVLEKIKDL